MVWKNDLFSYGWILNKYNFWIEKLKIKKVLKGSVVVVEADFSPNSVALLLALINHKCIFVPITKSVQSKRDEFIKIAQGEILFVIDEKDQVIGEEVRHDFDISRTKKPKTRPPEKVFKVAVSTQGRLQLNCSSVHTWAPLVKGVPKRTGADVPKRTGVVVPKRTGA